MIKSTNEQIQAILDGAPEGAVYFDGDDYSDMNGLVWCGKSLEWYECGHFLCGTPLETYREILTLRQEVERLKSELLEAAEIIDESTNYHVLAESLRIATKERDHE